MASDLLSLLLRMTLVTTVAVLAVSIVRKPCRRAVGARAAYSLWLLVPASLAGLLLPSPQRASLVAQAVVGGPVGRAVQAASAALARTAAPNYYSSTGTLVWVAGCLAMAAYIAFRHAAFVRSLGIVHPRPDGTYHSSTVREPMLLGTWRPRIVLPGDFESRYTPKERALILAHERAHLARRDALANVSATGFLCIFWLNPLMYWAIGRFRFDQELACDALVLAGSGAGASAAARRQYAETLLKAHLGATVPASASLGCGWQSIHPLKERIAMLRHPLPGRWRRLGGAVLSAGLMLSAAYATWAAQPRDQASNVRIMTSATRIAVGLRWLIDGAEILHVGGGSREPDMVVTSGSEFALAVRSAAGLVYQARCTASMQRADTASPARSEAKGRSAADEPQILLVCNLSSERKVLARPTLVVADGQPAAIEMADPSLHGGTDLRLEINASTSAARIAAALQ